MSQLQAELGTLPAQGETLRSVTLSCRGASLGRSECLSQGPVPVGVPLLEAMAQGELWSQCEGLWPRE